MNKTGRRLQIKSFSKINIRFFTSYVKTKHSIYYRDNEVYKKELQNLFLPSWQYFCTLSQLQQPGSYVSRVMLNYPIFAIAGKDKSIKVFHNVCSHRGSCILPEDSANRVDVLRCGYHGWCFNQSGNLITAPFYDKQELDYSKLSLKPVQFRIWRNLVFVNLKNDNPPDLNYQLELLNKELDVIDLENNYIFAKDFEYPVNDFNWKLLMENNLENSHVQYVHPNSFMKYWDEKYNKAEVLNYEDRHFCTLQLYKNEKPLDGRWSYLWPNHIFSLYSDYCLWERIYPVDIRSCKSFFTIFLNKNSEEYKKNNSDCIATVDKLLSLSNNVNKEDFGSCKNQQRNMENDVYETGFIHNYWDQGTAIFEKYYLDNLKHNL
jgi:choline monooxygenase